MDLGQFKDLVDASTQLPSGDLEQSSEELLATIRSCFSPEESSKARSDILEIVHGLGLRYRCDGTPCDRYLGVAQALREALKQYGQSTQVSGDWVGAIQAATVYATQFLKALGPEIEWRTDVRVSQCSLGIARLRSRGYEISLPSRGGIEITPEEVSRLASDIHRLASSLGSGLADSISAALSPNYSVRTGRFHIGRTGGITSPDPTPVVPLAYLYHLGLRYFQNPTTAEDPAATLQLVVDLVTHAVATLDLATDVFDLLAARPTDIPRIVQESLIYDATFLLTQVKPAHARIYLESMMSHDMVSRLSDAKGRTLQDIVTMALMMLNQCEKEAPDTIAMLDKDGAIGATKSDLHTTAELLRDVFVHQNGANQKLSFPPKDNEIDASFRPLLEIHGRGFFLQPPPMAARAIVNATTDWCRRNFQTKNFDEVFVGPALEEMVRRLLKQHGVTILDGNYAAGNKSSECDGVVETTKAVVFLELKSKLMTRQGRSGDDVQAFRDLAQALVKPHAQAMSRHAFLLKEGAMTLRRGTVTSTIILNGREVLKVCITRGDLGCLHDRIFLRRFLSAGCVATFHTLDPGSQHELGELNKWFGKLRSAAVSADEADFRSLKAFSRSWSLSVFQLLLLLDLTTDNESFVNELQRTRRFATPRHDFYSDYEYALNFLGAK